MPDAALHARQAAPLLRDTLGKRFVAGVVLYDGEAILGFGDRLLAVPIRALSRPTD